MNAPVNLPAIHRVSDALGPVVSSTPPMELLAALAFVLGGCASVAVRQRAYASEAEAIQAVCDSLVVGLKAEKTGWMLRAAPAGQA